MTKDYRIPFMMDFLKEIAAHNERPWFQEHKDLYNEVRDTFDTLSSDLIAHIGSFDDNVKGLTAKDCTYRFYRDVRFSLDKSPYKIHLGCYVNAKGKKSLHGGYYLHLQPGECLLAGGCWQLPTKILRVIRQTIVDGEDTFRKIVEEPDFKRLFPTFTSDPLKTLPRDVPKDFSHPEYLKCRNYCICNEVPDAFFNHKDWMEEVTHRFKLMRPFMDFINDTVDDYI